MTRTDDELLETLRDGFGHHQAGRLGDAERAYRTILQAQPDHADANFLSGLLAHQSGNSEAAIERITRAIDAEPKRSDFHVNLATIHLGLGRTAEAIEDCRRALAIDPAILEAHNIAGTALRAEGRGEESVASFDAALAIDPKSADTHYNKGVALAALERFEEAVASYDAALAVRPDFVEAHNNKGDALMGLDDPAAALMCFEQALALNSEVPVLHLNKGKALRGLGRCREAVDSHDRALALRPDYAEAHLNKGIAAHESGDPAAAMACFDAALALEPDNAVALNNKGISYREQNRPADALACYDRALDADPEYAEAHNNKGNALQELGRIDDAVACYLEALVHKSDYVEAFRNLTQARTFTEPDDAFNRMTALWEDGEGLSDEQRLQLAFGLGKACEDLGRFERSFELIEEANRLKRSTFSYDPSDNAGTFRRLIETAGDGFFDEGKETGCDDETPIFIVGMPRSGTSLVEQILASHSQVFGAGELDDLDRVLDRALGSENGIAAIDRLGGLDASALEALGADYVARLEEVSDGAAFVTDKMPFNFRYVGAIKLILPRAKVVHCRRHPMDTCWSIFKRHFVRTYRFAYDLEELGHYHALYEELMAHWRLRLPGFVHDIDYEDLVAQPERRTKELLAFCGLDWEDACMAFHETDRAVRTASAAQVRKPIYTDSVELWRRYETRLEPLRRALEVAPLSSAGPGGED